MSPPVLITCNPGAHTSVQDFGRIGYRHLGVPTSGALDRHALRLVNRLVGNPANTAGLEFLYLGPVFEVASDTLRIAISGTRSTIELLDTPGHVCPAWQSLRLVRGQRFKISMAAGLVCCYLAVEGGFDLNEVMGSQSTYTRAGFGGFKGRILAQGDEIPLNLNTVRNAHELCFPHPPDESDADAPIRITWGQQADYFTADALACFTSQEYTISPASDRMGYRVSGFQLTHKDSFNIVSDGTAVGAIQVPGDGAPIILLADCQTSGGYPKIATVISSDLARLARRPPGSKVRFSALSISQAEAIAREQEASIHVLENTTRHVRSGSELDVEALYDANLISGMFDASD